LNNVNYTQLMQILSRPRPSGSVAERETIGRSLQTMQSLLQGTYGGERP
jgi:hypothetical protein